MIEVVGCFVYISALAAFAWRQPVIINREALIRTSKFEEMRPMTEQTVNIQSLEAN